MCEGWKEKDHLGSGSGGRVASTKRLSDNLDMEKLNSGSGGRVHHGRGGQKGVTTCDCTETPSK